VTQRAGTFTRFVTRRHSSESTCFAKPIPATVGWRMLSVHDCGADVATFPDASRALLAL
jgi:hypothetical protein